MAVPKYYNLMKFKMVALKEGTWCMESILKITNNMGSAI